MSQIIRLGSGVVPPGTYVQQIDGDTGSATGAIITFTANPSAGSSITFDAAGSTVTFNVTDGDNNTILGGGSGNGSITGTDNSGFGNIVLPALTTGNENTAVGMGALNALEDGSANLSLGQSSTAFLVSGNNNTIVGSSSALSYDSTESNNIIIGSFVNGVMGESNVLRISAATGAGQGKINKAFIHGMRGITEATADEVLINASTGQIISIPAGTTGDVLTSQGVGANPVWSAPAASGITTIDGDVGSVTGSTVKFSGDGGSNYGGSTLRFQSVSATEMALFASDSGDNTFIGQQAGVVGNAAGGNTALGSSALASLSANPGEGAQNTVIGAFSGGITSGDINTILGYNSAPLLLTGDQNVFLGAVTAGNYTGSESSNILIGYSVAGTVGESNVLRIGTASGVGSGELSEAYIQGIASVVVANKEYVTIDTTTGQLGSDSGPASSFTWSVITIDQTAAVNNGYICNKAGTLALALPATSAVGDIIEVTGINTALGWQITQAVGQQIFFGTSSTTLGAAGTLTSSATRDAIRIVCIIANTTWQVLSVIGNISVV